MTSNFMLFVFLFAVELATGDRLEPVHQASLTGPLASAQSTPALSFPYENLGQYKNLPKNTVNSYTTSVPLSHKSHYVSSSTLNTPVSERRGHLNVQHRYNQNPEYRYNPNVEHRSHDVIPIVKQAFEPNSGDGGYAYSYETANGISVSENGVYKAGLTNEEGVQSASGSYSYTGPDNVVYTVTYIAGSEGFVPQGAHLPTPPPIPEAIQKVIQYAGTNELDKYPTYNENVKYTTYSDSSKYPTYNDGVTATSSKYTSALPIPYSGYNSAYSKLASYDSKYEVQDNYARK